MCQKKEAGPAISLAQCSDLKFQARLCHSYLGFKHTEQVIFFLLERLMGMITWPLESRGHLRVTGRRPGEQAIHAGPEEIARVFLA